MDAIASPPRRYHTHRKRVSALHLSSDSVPSLPVYSSPLTSTPSWKERPQEDLHSDRPPDYPDSSEEADADESDQDLPHNTAYVSPFPTKRIRSPRHSSPRSLQYRYHLQTSSDTYLDSLLARSVHALEMSNVLLQTSMTTQASFSNILSPESTSDCSLDRALDISSRVKRDSNVHEAWMDDIDEIEHKVNGLLGYGDDSQERRVERNTDPVSCSLPNSSPLRERPRRRPSLQPFALPEGHLDYSNHTRSHFISPAPRALTVYIDSNDAPDAIQLPPTLGHRNTPSAHLIQSAPHSPPIPESSKVERSPRAYDILSSYVTSSGASNSWSSSIVPSPSDSRSSSTRCASTNILERQHSRSSERSVSSTVSSASKTPRGRSLTPSRVDHPPIRRHMTPPIEELSSNSSSSEISLAAVRSLRKILDNQAQADQAKAGQEASESMSSSKTYLRPRTLNIRNSAEPIASTSHATASVSRLLTKNKHSSSTRPPSPPSHSSLKIASIPACPTPSPSPSQLSVPGFFSGNSPKSGHSGRTTPSRVTFAELPESYASSKPEGSSVRFSGRKKDHKKEKGGILNERKNDDEERLGRWWSSWLLGGGTPDGRHEERVEERAARWSMRPPGTGLGGMDDWTF